MLRQAKEAGITPSRDANYALITNEKAFELLKRVADFESVIEQAAEHRAPHRITNYIQDLAAHFHKFYNAEKVLTDDIEKSRAYVAMIEAVRITLQNALTLVGVSSPEKM